MLFYMKVNGSNKTVTFNVQSVVSRDTLTNSESLDLLKFMALFQKCEQDNIMYYSLEFTTAHFDYLSQFGEIIYKKEEKQLWELITEEINDAWEGRI